MALKPANWTYVFVRLRWFALSFAFVVTLVMGFFATKLTFNFSPDNIYLASDPAHQFYVSRFLNEFGQRANLCIVAIDGDIKNSNVQRALTSLHEGMEKITEVQSVRSLANTSVYLMQNGMMELTPVFGDDKRVNLAAIDFARRDPVMQNLLVNQTGDAPTVLVQLPLHFGDQATTDAVVMKLKNVIDDVAGRYPTLKFYLAGTPVLQQEAITTLKHDQLVFVPLVALLMAILLWLSFHNWRGVVLPFLATGSATVWAIGWLVLMGHPLDIVNNKLIVLLLVIGTSCAVQFFARFQDEILLAKKHAQRTGEALNRDDIVARCVQALTIPCLLTTTTAALGFGAVVVAKVGIIRHFGIDAAVGVMFSYITTMLLVPALLRILPLPKKGLHALPVQEKESIFSIDHLLGVIARFSMRFAPIVIGVAVLITLAGLWIAKDIHADQRLSSELPADAPSVVALDFIERHLTGIMPFDIVLEGNPSRLMEPEVIRAAAKLEEFAAAQPLKPTMRSFSDLLRSFDHSLSPDKPLEPVSTWSDAKIAQLLLLFETADSKLVQEARRDFISSDGRFYRIQGLIKDANTEELGLLRDRLIDELAKTKLAGVKTHLTGAAIISTNALSYMITTLITSLGVAVLAIFLLVLILLRSFRFAFIILLPNLVPIVTTVAAMQILGIKLRVATVMTFSMALGIAVDACIYLVTRFREEAILHHLESNGESPMFLSIIERTMRGSGRPVVYITLMLLAGFSVLGISKFAALRDFAILSSVTLATALIVDLLLWPALVIVVKPPLKFVKKSK